MMERGRGSFEQGRAMAVTATSGADTEDANASALVTGPSGPATRQVRAEPSRPTKDGRLGRRYWRLWSASTISNLGDGMFMVANPLLATRITNSSFQIALVT